MVFRKFLCLGQSFGKTYLEKGKLGICWTPIILHFAVMPLLSPFFLLMSPLRPCNYLLWCHNRLPEISRRNMSIMIAFWDHNIHVYIYIYWQKKMLTWSSERMPIDFVISNLPTLKRFRQYICSYIHNIS